MEIEPDTKDWTWVLARVCAECGFDAAAVDREQLGERIRANAAGWDRALAGDAEALRARPRPDVWSVLEYACHVRDVHRVFADRLALMLDEHDPAFANWDQDRTAVAEDYGRQVPAAVRDELRDAARRVAAAYDAVGGTEWDRTGRRSNGSAFTVDTLGRYHLHDVVHHLVDVGVPPEPTP